MIQSSTDPPLVAPLGFRPNSFFVGFDLELHDLEHKLQSKKRNEIGTCASLIYGPPGCGKSYLVREYVWRHRLDYQSGIFWVDCKTLESTYKSFYDIAQFLGLVPDADGGQSAYFIDVVRDTLKTLQGWLLVFDGVSFDSDDDIQHFLQFIPDRQGNSIIYTSVDKTLARRQRLLNPSAVKVRPLSEADACTLLYKSLNIRVPTPQEEVKALQLVKHYECLPLAIHAAAHVLIARGSRLAQFSPGVSDSRLQGPYTEIITLLKENHRESYNLLVVLSFLDHHVPVALLRYGRGGLLDLGIEIRSQQIQGGSTRKELDNSIATLIRHGLIERGNQQYVTSSPRAVSSSPEQERHELETTDVDAPNEDSTKLDHTIERVRTSSTKSTTASVDTLRIHSVVQKIIHDQLKYRDSSFQAQLCHATRLLITSYATACSRMGPGVGLNRDHREYRSQASRLWSHFPRDRAKASPEVRKARHELHECVRAIHRELETRSPSQSSDDSRFRPATSVFDCTSDSSVEGRTPTSTFTRASTWSIERSSSPDHWDENHEDVLGGLQQALLAEQAYEAESMEPTDSMGGLRQERLAEQAYESDEGSMHWTDGAPSRRWSRSDTTEVPIRYANLSAIFKGTAARRPKKDLGEWKPVPIAPTVSRPEVESRRSSSNTSLPRPAFSSSEAEAALAAMHKMSPPPSRGGSRIRSPTRHERPPLTAKSTNTQFAMLNPPANDEISRHHKRHMSTSPRLLAAALFNRATRESRDDVPDGYTSLPMSRDNSASSHTSLHTAPPGSLNTTPASPMPIQVRHIDATDIAFSHMSDWATPPRFAAEDRLSTSLGGRHVQFGEMAPISVTDARRRVENAKVKDNNQYAGISSSSL